MPYTTANELKTGLVDRSSKQNGNIAKMAALIEGLNKTLKAMQQNSKIQN